jgi:hypothetical protein
MSIEDLVLAGMGFRRVEPQARPEVLRPHEAGNWPMGMARPNPTQPDYGRARTNFDAWRKYTSPLGGVSASSWGIAPRTGDDALKPQYRHSTRKWG